MKVALYFRVSTLDQNTNLQKDELRTFADRQGWEVSNVYEDKVSGRKAMRPGLDALLLAMRKGEFNARGRLEAVQTWPVCGPPVAIVRGIPRALSQAHLENRNAGL